MADERPLPVPEATLALLPAPDRIEAAIVKAEEHLARKPDRWSSLEQRGRARRLLGLPGAADDLVATAARLVELRERPMRGWQLLQIANLLRMAGSSEATGWFQAVLDADAPSPSYDQQPVATACFHLGLDAEAEARVAQLRGPSPVHLAIDAMARSRRTGGIGDLAAHRELLAGYAVREGPWGPGSGYSVWDAIEDADRVLACL